MARPGVGLLVLGICGLCATSVGCRSEPDRATKPRIVRSLQGKKPAAPKAAPEKVAPRAMGESVAQGGRLRHWLPAQQLPQTMVFSRYRWAWLHDEVVRVWRTGDFQRVAHFEAPGARSLQVLAGGGFVADGESRLYRLSPMGLRPRMFSRAPRLGPTRLFPSSRDSRRLFLHFDSSDRIWEFLLTDDSELLGKQPQSEAALPVLPLQVVQTLPGFDRRALTLLRDDSVVYTRSGGLGRRHRGQRLEAISSDFHATVWSLLPGRALHEVWVAMQRRLVLVALGREQKGAVVRAFELPANTLAVASSRTRVAWLSLSDAGRGRYQVDVRSLLTDRAWVVRGDVVASRARVELRPELRLAPTKNLLSLWLGELHVIDYERDSIALRVRPGEGAEAD